MREIKFRAWSISTHTMYELDTSKRNGNLNDLYEGSSGTWKVMQFTGLKDKNGKEIYEGDLLGDIFGDGGHISYCDDCASFELHYPIHGCMACSGDVHWFDIVAESGSVNNRLEVIGNIYENPELLQDQ